MQELSLSTGAVSGLTGLKIQTIQRYVRHYPQGFTEPARQSKQGRRFTGQDIKTLMLIHHLMTSKRANMVEKALSGEWIPPDLPAFEIADLMTIYRSLQTMNAKTERLNALANKTLKDIQLQRSLFRREKSIERIDNDIAELTQLFNQNNKRLLMLEIFTGISRKKKVSEYDLPDGVTEAPKRRGWLGR